MTASIMCHQHLPEHGVSTVFVELPNTKIEVHCTVHQLHQLTAQLLFPLGEKSPIAAFLAKNKEGGMHHICIEVK